MLKCWLKVHIIRGYLRYTQQGKLENQAPWKLLSQHTFVVGQILLTGASIDAQVTPHISAQLRSKNLICMVQQKHQLFCCTNSNVLDSLVATELVEHHLDPSVSATIVNFS